MGHEQKSAKTFDSYLTVCKIFENLRTIIGFFSATKSKIETVFALLGSLCLQCLLLKVETQCFHIIIFRR